MDISVLQSNLFLIAEPNRFRIIEMLKKGPCSVNELVMGLDMGQPQVSRHLRILSDAGLVKVQRKAQQRIYRLESKPFRELDAWFDTFSLLWEERLDKFESYLTDLKKEEE
jgi:DNA-binding transcriptional ArsR family regulator